MMKLGIHINSINNSVYSTLGKVRPQIIKTLDFNTDALRAYKETVGGFVIGRKYFANQDVGNSLIEAEEKGRIVATDMWYNIEAIKYGYVDAVETYNEIFPMPDDVLSQSGLYAAHRRYDVFQNSFRNRMLELSGNKVETIAFNFGTGHGLGNTIQELYQLTLENFTYLGFHEYDWPYLFATHDLDLAHGGNGMWLALRYRRIMEHIRKTWTHHQVIITECGITQGVVGGPDTGWRSSPQYLNSPSVEAQVYWENSIRRYEQELVKDDYVKGGVIFCAGAPYDWYSFEIIPEITEYMQNYIPDPPPPAPPPLVEPPEQPDLECMYDYQDAWQRGYIKGYNDGRETGVDYVTIIG